MKKDEFTDAYNYASLLLKYRDRAINEIIIRLERKKFSKGTIEKVIDKLLSDKLLDDNKFATKYIETQIKRGKSFNLILFELEKKFGINKNNIVNKEMYQKTQYNNICNILKKKFGTECFTNNNDIKQKLKIQNFLLRRGFSYTEIKDIINIGRGKNKIIVEEENN